MLSCVDGMEYDQEFKRALGNSRSWRMTGPHLELYPGRKLYRKLLLRPPDEQPADTLLPAGWRDRKVADMAVHLFSRVFKTSCDESDHVSIVDCDKERGWKVCKGLLECRGIPGIGK